MRRVILIHLCGGLGLALTVTVSAQNAAPTAIAPSAATAVSPSAQPSATPAAGGIDTSRSLFDPTWHQFQFGGRFTSVDGDPARFQRYQDLGSGVLFTDARYAREDAGGAWMFRAAADNVGWRDQRYAATYERTGRLVVNGFWDQIPQFYSVDTKTPYTPAPSPLLLDDATQRSIQNAQANLNAYVPLATQFDLRERRDIGSFNLKSMLTPQLDLTAAFTTTRHRGELPWGASFGFSNDVEVALPYDSRTNDVTAGSEWTNGRNMIRVSYNGSWFDNLDDTLVWDSPLRLDDSTVDPGRGRMALWPTNSAQTISAAGYTKWAHRTQLTGFVSYGLWSNDQPLQPFTINTALPQLVLPRANTDGEAKVFSTNLNLVSRPVPAWQFTARVRRYDYNNKTPETLIPQFINYDDAVTTSSTGGPARFAHDRTNFDADAIWSGLQPLAITVGYSRNNTGYDVRTFESTGENVLRLSADAVGSQWMTFRAQYEHGDRNGSGLDEQRLLTIGEQPSLRYYDLANRTRDKFTGQVDVVPNDTWTFSLSGGTGKDNYGDSYFGLQESTFRTFSAAADYQANGLGAGASYNYERYFGLQNSRSASPGQENDPLRDWSTDSTEHVNYFSIFVAPPKVREKTEVRLTYDFSLAKGDYLYTVVPGGPLPPPSQLPEVHNQLQQLHLDVRHRLTNRVAATFSYLYEPFDVYDFAFDPTVVNGIVQPSSLVLGMVYRPYTAHSAFAGIRYLW